ncbi:hypothetical protein KKD84_03380, partial [Patescibacteria group bacterium]|nr:hypothetical protein [Patescibacteria group bacterium]
IKSASGPGVYVVSDGFRRPIPSAEVFEGLGYKWGNVIEISEKAMSLHPLGDPVYLLPGDTNQ